MAKTVNVEKSLEALAGMAFGTSRADNMSAGLCVRCGKPADWFKDELSKKEYRISGLCQNCQNDFFGGLEGW